MIVNLNSEQTAYVRMFLADYTYNKFPFLRFLPRFFISF